ncbi:MAG: hypothetical protein HY819_19290 [Acidobacteria bacterium]|nr:hypothetical protein [Acidobacteriota bacterium]
MRFQEKFLGTKNIKTNSLEALSSFGSQSSLIGWKANQSSLDALEKLLQKTFQNSIDRVIHRQALASPETLEELKQQEVELNYLIEKFNYNTKENIAEKCQQITDYLGLEFSQIRWVMEPYTHTSKKAFQNLVDSLNDPTKQSFKEAIKCFEIGEYSFAKEQINNVLANNRTNYFAYQYLGFIGVIEDDSETALVNFKFARKFADTDYQKALAFSHLAIGCYALDELEKAIELTERATQEYPLLARFWYQLAKYKALTQDKESTFLALRNAIKCDWTFWGIAILDTHFDHLQTELNQFFAKLRQEQKEETLSLITNLKKAIATAKQFGAGYNLSKSITTLASLEECYPNSHIFNYLELILQASECHNNVFQISEKYLKDRISEKRSFLTQQDANKVRDIKDLELPIAALAQEKKQLKLLHTSWNIGCGGYVLLNLFSLVLIVCLVLFISPKSLLMPSPIHINYLNTIIILLLSTALALVIPLVINRISYINKVTAKERKIEQEIQNKKRTTRQQKTKIEEESKVLKSKTEEELKQLENLLEICQNKRYL